MMTGTVLILGSNGRFGRHAAEAFWNNAWTIRTFDRALDDLGEAARGADVIVNAWNPPYTQWAREVPEMTTRVIEAAKASGATVILPGNVYVFGEGAGPVLGADTPHGAMNPLGRIRIEMEAAYRASCVQTIVLRAGDFIDTEPSGNWFDKVITDRADKGRFAYPGALDQDHAWAYLPDLAEAAARLAAIRDQLEAFVDVPFPGYTLTGRVLGDLTAEAMGRPLAIRPMGWVPIQLARPFWSMAKHLLEMRYLWSMPHRLDGARIDALLPHFRATDPVEALRRATRHKINPNQPVPGRTVRVAV